MTTNRALFYYVAVFFFSLSYAALPAYALDHRFDLDTDKLSQNLPKKPEQVSAPAKAASPRSDAGQPVNLPKKPEQVSVPVKAASPRSDAGQTVYTVKPGDFLMKILMREFGMNDDAASRFLPEIQHLNHISDVHRLKVGARLVIPLPAKNIHHTAKSVRLAGSRAIKPVNENNADSGLRSMIRSRETRNEEVENIKLVWEKLIPRRNWPNDAVSIQGKNYSLELKANSFPLFPAADSGKILVEAGGSLSPLVKSLIREHDPGIRFVTYIPRNPKRLISSMLSVAGFYSVEENFSIDFGDDPKLTVTADFKVEKNEEGALQQDIALINIDPRRVGLPGILSDYLGRQGLHVVEPFQTEVRKKLPEGGQIQVVADKDPLVMADKLMSALDMPCEQDKEVVLNMMDGDVALRVKVNRYFEKNGEKFVLSTFHGDAESYTLLMLLESIGYKVIIFSPDEDFRSVSRMFLSRIHLPSQYTLHNLLNSNELRYGIKMSGVMLKSPGGHGNLFLTSSQPDRLIGDLLSLNGYTLPVSR